MKTPPINKNILIILSQHESLNLNEVLIEYKKRKLKPEIDLMTLSRKVLALLTMNTIKFTKETGSRYKITPKGINELNRN